MGRNTGDDEWGRNTGDDGWVEMVTEGKIGGVKRVMHGARIGEGCT